jgi:AcrR family transcriptional regulator
MERLLMSELTRKEIDRHRREDDFLMAAEKLFSQKGYHGTSIEDIAQEAKYGTGTIYRYFETKEALYAALLERKFREFMRFLQAQVAAAFTPRDKVRTLINGRTEFFRKDKEFLRIYAAAGASLRWTLRDRFHEQLKDVRREYRAFVADTLRGCMKPGGLRKMDPVKLASVFSAMTGELLLEALQDGGDQGMEECRRFLLDLVENGFYESTTVRARKESRAPVASNS